MISSFPQQNIFQDDLMSNEEILWSGKPDPSVNFNRTDIFLIPFTLLWLGFFFIPLTSALLYKPHSQPIDLGFLLFLIPFFTIGFYVTIGRFVYKKIKKHYTYYAVTNKHVLIITALFGKNLQSEYIGTLAAINKSIRRSGIGTIIFGNNSSRWAKYANTGMDFFANFSGSIAAAFYDIKDANKVYKLIADIRNTQSIKI